jgi:hypothetical protein
VTRTAQPEVDPTMALFASSSVPVHLVRGALGLAVLVMAVLLARSTAWWLLLTPLTVVLWRGCPTCWAMGLVATRARCRC